ncbi:hypothetical protein ACPA9J_05980 [Pseudomonas aeruginosa]
MQTPELNAPYIAEMARAEMVGRYGSEAYTEGWSSPRSAATCRTPPANRSATASSTMTSATATAARRPACRARPATPGSSTWASSAASAAWSRRSSPRWKERDHGDDPRRQGRSRDLGQHEMGTPPSSATTAWARCRASPPTWPRPATRSACSARKTAPCASYRFPPHRAR